MLNENWVFFVFDLIVMDFERDFSSSCMSVMGICALNSLMELFDETYTPYTAIVFHNNTIITFVIKWQYHVKV